MSDLIPVPVNHWLKAVHRNCSLDTKVGLDLKTTQLELSVNYFSAVRDLVGIFSKPPQEPIQSALKVVLLTRSLGLPLTQVLPRGAVEQALKLPCLRDEEAEILIHQVL